ncbi:hypothetical protein COW96_02275 [Candidatus Roizmanbacteria bacterium CG22_combo_CG10-13_8_21_14_all_33_16]|uniref:Uncharacterized protein n=1 Tax=Candidatus Roizmanbacteria bacterium CG22_combo_CG10-13_8_21_14_all_33_16 TaxID=1974859 RepID=A0A2H0C3J1_9BACT|nr:MAG: hypothetical protein COW96_02275 [Candidatus Roizmanbacteria bacterium CG22_combo_CG10-13_8_21_14_all_33_16]
MGAWKLPKNQEVREIIRSALTTLQTINEFLMGDLSENDRFDLRGISTMLINELKQYGLTDEMLQSPQITSAASDPLTVEELLKRMLT